MKIALAQINTTIGDFEGNRQRILEAYRRGVAAGVDLVVTPELALCGYPPQDLLLRPAFLRKNRQCLESLAGEIGSVGLVVGFAEENTSGIGRPARNAAALLHQGRIAAVRYKTLLPTYDVFNEDRYFEPAERNEPVVFAGKRLGITICEDIWNQETFTPRRYPHNPVDELVQAGAEILLNLSASPWYLGKDQVRHELLRTVARRRKVPVLYCNLVGGNDELLFDGASLACSSQGETLAMGKLFEEDFLLVDLDQPATSSLPPEMSDEEKLFRALTMGTRDYLKKCGFRSAVLGLSGGIDSALTACIAAAALGPENVLGVSLPSQYSSQSSLEDARALAQNLGIQYTVVPIQRAFEVIKSELAPLFTGRPEDITEENIQARIRGMYLMAISNKLGHLLLNTGNKSELATGYCTLYGDMCGGLAVIGDLPKTTVYRVARWVNREQEIIPESTLTKPPSAELRPGQKDQDSLPPYEVLDQILERYVVQCRSAEEIIAEGFDPNVVAYTIRLIDRSEYKRRQAAPALKVTTRAFGTGRRIPIAQKYQELP